MAGEDDDGGVLLPGHKVAEGIKNIFTLLLAIIGIVIAWLVATGFCVFFAVTLDEGTPGRGLVINLLASLVLIALAPLMLSLIATNPRRLWLFGIVGAVVLVAAWYTAGGVQDFLLNFGSGLWLVLAVDYHVVARYRAWAEEMEQRAQKMGKEPAFLVL